MYLFIIEGSSGFSIMGWQGGSFKNNQIPFRQSPSTLNQFFSLPIKIVTWNAAWKSHWNFKQYNESIFCLQPAF